MRAEVELWCGELSGVPSGFTDVFLAVRAADTQQVSRAMAVTTAGSDRKVCFYETVKFQEVRTTFSIYPHLYLLFCWVPCAFSTSTRMQFKFFECCGCGNGTD